MYYEIVPMDRSHIEEIAALEKECFSTPWTEQMLTDALFDSQASFIVAEVRTATSWAMPVSTSSWTRAISTTSP